MAQAAVPKYLGNEFDSVSPGQRFQLFIGMYKTNWELDKDNKREALKQVLALRDHSDTLKALLARQSSLADAQPVNSMLTVPARSSAPFSTGLGYEHPTENGFAFLSPYGLPYLAGSSVKGVLRKAAQELAEGLFGATEGWTCPVIDALFGTEGDTGHNRGALTFWDVLPQPAGDSLSIEVMTPHQTSYYEGKSSPHDSGNPIPIYFLAVPAGSSFQFNVQCNRALLFHLDATLLTEDRWKLLMDAAFRHAFDWLGFGAKTAVGYGAMIPPAAKKKPAFEAQGVRWEAVEIKLDKGPMKISAFRDRRTATVQAPRTHELLAKLPPAWVDAFKKKQKATAHLTVEVQGNSSVIIGIEVPQ